MSNPDKPLFTWMSDYYLSRIKDLRLGFLYFPYSDANNKCDAGEFILSKKVITSQLIKELLL